MGIEIERKFLVEGDSWRRQVDRSVEMLQGYMRADDATIRVRIRDGEGILTFKGKTIGVTRGEWQWPIPTQDARELIENFCGDRLIEKVRNYVVVGDHEWVVDEFAGRHEGLLLAEIELGSEDEEFQMPEWAGDEVSDDPQYFNSVLAGDDHHRTDPPSRDDL